LDIYIDVKFSGVGGMKPITTQWTNPSSDGLEAPRVEESTDKAGSTKATENLP
jgi:hypothetical protein